MSDSHPNKPASGKDAPPHETKAEALAHKQELKAEAAEADLAKADAAKTEAAATPTRYRILIPCSGGLDVGSVVERSAFRPAAHFTDEAAAEAATDAAIARLTNLKAISQEG